MYAFPFVFIPLHVPTPIFHIPTVTPCIPIPIPRIATLISAILTLIPRIPIIPTLILRMPIIPLILFPTSPFRLLQIAVTRRQIVTCFFKKYKWVQSLLFEHTSFLLHCCIVLHNHFHNYLQSNTRALIMCVLI